MRIAATSALIATAIAGGSIGLAQASTTQYTAPTVAASATGLSRHVLPTTYKSWVAQKDALRVCPEMRKIGTAQWIDCLVGHYEAKTSYRLNEYEFTANKAKNTFKVTWSKVTLPKGGVAMSKRNKEARKLPTDVYFKSYGLDNGALILGSNGTSFQE